MNFQQSIKICFSKYADFNGRASRPEYWWFALFIFLASAVLSMLGSMLPGIFAVATLLPSLAVAVRRLRDTGRSGWWLLIGLVPVVGFIVLIYFLLQKSVNGTLAGPQVH